MKGVMYLLGRQLLRALYTSCALMVYLKAGKGQQALLKHGKSRGSHDSQEEPGLPTPNHCCFPADCHHLRQCFL